MAKRLTCRARFDRRMRLAAMAVRDAKRHLEAGQGHSAALSTTAASDYMGGAEMLNWQCRLGQNVEVQAQISEVNNTEWKLAEACQCRPRWMTQPLAGIRRR